MYYVNIVLHIISATNVNMHFFIELYRIVNSKYFCKIKDMVVPLAKFCHGKINIATLVTSLKNEGLRDAEGFSTL